MDVAWKALRILALTAVIVTIIAAALAFPGWQDGAKHFAILKAASEVPSGGTGSPTRAMPKLLLERWVYSSAWTDGAGVTAAPYGTLKSAGGGIVILVLAFLAYQLLRRIWGE